MKQVYKPKDTEETKFVLWLLRRFGMYPELSGEHITVPDDEEKISKHFINTMGNDFEMNKDLTPVIENFIMGL